MTSHRWTPVAVRSPAQSRPNGFGLAGPHAHVQVTAWSDHVVRVRTATTARAGRTTRSLAVLDPPQPPDACEIVTASGRTTLRTSGLSLTVHHDPLVVEVIAPDGTRVQVDDAVRGTVLIGDGIEAHLALRPTERVFGLGQKNGPHDHRGKRSQGTSRVLWNTDHFAHDAGSDPIYAGVPFLLFLHEGRCHGLFVDDAGRLHADIGHAHPEVLSLRARRGELDRYIIAGPTPRDVLMRYAALTGRPPMPPRWALGFHQCRYSYMSADEVRRIAREFRERDIPCDAIWLDIHHLEGFRPLHWDRQAFPDPRALCGELREQGFRVVTIVDPHLAAIVGDPRHDAAVAGDHLVRNPDGSIHHAPVWPAHGPEPCDSVFPDFTNAATRSWWGEQLRDSCDDGVGGIWNDMNEPAVFGRNDRTFPGDLRHESDQGPVRHDEVHNAYGALMSRATWEGLARLRPHERPFVLTRATWAGGQRWAFCWTGDVRSDWGALQQSIATLLSMSVSGLPFAGSDIGGFVGAPEPELFTRWLQASVLTPFARAHTNVRTPPQEPWSHGPEHEARNRRAIQLRYELLPHVEHVVRECCATGLPVMRPLWVEFPDDDESGALTDQFLLGADLLVAPVLWSGVSQRRIHLPPGEWFDLVTGERHVGPGSLVIPVDLDSIPILARAGAIVLRQPVVAHTGLAPTADRILDVYPGAGAIAWIDDDGITPDGPRREREIRHARSGASAEVTIGAAHGPFRPPMRRLLVRLPGAGAVRRVRVDGRDSPCTAGDAARGWWRDDADRVVVAVPGEPREIAVAIEFD